MRIIFILLLTLPASILKAQDYKFKYFFDRSFNSVDENKAEIIGKGKIENGLMLLDCFDTKTGLPVISAHFIDSSLSVLQGKYIAYHSNGNKEKEGDYINGIEWGLWKKWDPAGRLTDSMLYQKSALIAYRLNEYHPNGSVSSIVAGDNRDSSYSITQFDSAGRKVGEIVQEGKNTVFREYEGGRMVKNRIIKAEDYLPSIKGGQKAWVEHVKSTLNINAVSNNVPDGIYKIIIRFTINKSGELTDIVPETNYGYGMEEEAIRVIMKKPIWKPASINGIPVTFILRQPITFSISN